MTTEELFLETKRLNIKLFLDNNELKYQALPGAFTPELIEAVKQHKTEIMAILEKETEIEGTIPIEGGIIYLPGFGLARVHKAQDKCMKTNCCECYGPTAQECELFPVVRNRKLTGWCREREPVGGEWEVTS